jgi:putative oxidoreductase
VPHRKRGIAVSVLRVLLALAFLVVGVAKLTGTLNTVETFEEYGWGQWFRYVTGVLDLTGALLVITSRWTFYGALLLTGTVGLAAALSVSRPIDFIPALTLALMAATLAWLTRPEGRMLTRPTAG